MFIIKNKILAILVFLSFCLCLTALSAEPEKPKDVDISDLDESYWRPNKDELEVVQNRRFDKTGRIELNLNYGLYQGGGYTNTKTVGLGVTYNWSNTWFTEVSYLKMNNSDSDFLKSVRSFYGFTPDFNREQHQYSVAMGWVPIYAKFSLLGKEISHFETYIAPGIGITETAANHLTEHLSIGEKFFVTEHFIFTLEWKMSHYTDEVAASQGAPAVQNGGPGHFQQSETKHNIIFGLGWMF